jgi:hypothetical protein
MFHVKHFQAVLDWGRKIPFNQRVILPRQAITAAQGVGKASLWQRAKRLLRGPCRGQNRPRRVAAALDKGA